jgi:hypothetical protein
MPLRLSKGSQLFNVNQWHLLLSEAGDIRMEYHLLPNGIYQDQSGKRRNYPPYLKDEGRNSHCFKGQPDGWYLLPVAPVGGQELMFKQLTDDRVFAKLGYEQASLILTLTKVIACLTLGLKKELGLSNDKPYIHLAPADSDNDFFGVQPILGSRYNTISLKRYTRKEIEQDLKRTSFSKFIPSLVMTNN